jgi:putative membrane protein insertion efficiency factor
MLSRSDEERSRAVHVWIGAIQIYQRLAPRRLRACCRFHPSCSEYAILAIEKFGCSAGVAKACTRILRCRPPHGGVDFP